MPFNQRMCSSLGNRQLLHGYISIYNAQVPIITRTQKSRAEQLDRLIDRSIYSSSSGSNSNHSVAHRLALICVKHPDKEFDRSTIHHPNLRPLGDPRNFTPSSSDDSTWSDHEIHTAYQHLAEGRVGVSSRPKITLSRAESSLGHFRSFIKQT